VREVILWSPPANAMEIMRYGLFGGTVRPYYDIPETLAFSVICMLFGLILCRHIRRGLVVA
jgi:capsular polysaccharide transport system permease protein